MQENENSMLCNDTALGNSILFGGLILDAEKKRIQMEKREDK